LPEERRNYTLAAIDSKMASTDYVHFFMQTTSTSFGNPPIWVGTDGRDAEIKEAAKSILIVSFLEWGKVRRLLVCRFFKAGKLH
jgi:hypothetical protein